MNSSTSNIEPYYSTYNDMVKAFDSLKNEAEKIHKKLEKIENLSKYALENVDKNPQEAKELFRIIYQELE